MTKTRSVLESVGKELKEKPPEILKRTASKFGSARAKKQRTAILLSKARRQGARVPKDPQRSLRS